MLREIKQYDWVMDSPGSRELKFSLSDSEDQSSYTHREEMTDTDLLNKKISICFLLHLLFSHGYCSGGLN